jgi:phosphotransacetylase/acyl dehydratase
MLALVACSVRFGTEWILICLKYRSTERSIILSEMNTAKSIRNTTWDELHVGASASIERTCSVQDLYLFAHVSGNLNPLMLPDGDATASHPVAPSLWVGSLVSAVLGNLLPGPGTLYRAQTLRFHGRARPGDKLVAEVRCVKKLEKPIAVFETRVITSDRKTLICDGSAEVEVPTQRIITQSHELPDILLQQHDHFARLLACAKGLPALRTLVVCPDDSNALAGAVLSADNGLIVPILVGDKDRIHAVAQKLELDIRPFEIVDVADRREAAAHAVALITAGKAAAIMKGNLHSDELLGEVVKKEGGLRGHRRISHVFAMGVPTLANLLFISDAAINIAPDLATKVDIVQNAIDLARACGVEQPRVGVLSAVETVNPNIPSTLDAAILSKMADRGQLKGAIVDGPLAMDNAVDVVAAQTKGIASLVAGHADVLIVPNIEAGNMLAKELTFVAKAEAAGLVVGARVPVMLTSRADNDRARLGSCALALLYEYWRRNNRSAFAVEALSHAAE